MKHEELKCFFCKQDITDERVMYSNMKVQFFIYMPLKTCAHLECYTKEICRIAINEI
jgi:hypothetical protein